MMFFLAMGGLVVAVVVFLNLLQAKEAVERVAGPERERVDLNSRDAQEIRQAKSLKERARMRRICPVCRTGLTSEEYLICAMEPEDQTPAGSKRQVQIYGCVHCFATDGVNMARYEKLQDINV